MSAFSRSTEERSTGLLLLRAAVYQVSKRVSTSFRNNSSSIRGDFRSPFGVLLVSFYTASPQINRAAAHLAACAMLRSFCEENPTSRREFRIYLQSGDTVFLARLRDQVLWHARATLRYLDSFSSNYTCADIELKLRAKKKIVKPLKWMRAVSTSCFLRMTGRNKTRYFCGRYLECAQCILRNSRLGEVRSEAKCEEPRD